MHYFYVLDTLVWRERILPALAACPVERTFAPLRRLLDHLPETNRESSLLARALVVPFDRHVHQAVIGEALVLGAAAVPRLPLDLATLAPLLSPEGVGRIAADRNLLAPIQRVFLGSHDLWIGSKPYRPLHVGWNDEADVRELATYLQRVDPMAWRAEALLALAELKTSEDRDEELALARDWWPDLVELYVDSDRAGRVIVCEDGASH